MDCGIPFCNNGCPVNNIIPDWNDLVYRGDWRNALDVLHSTNNFPEFTGRICPAPCEAACTLNINDDAGRHQVDRARDHRRGWERAGSCRSRRRTRPASASRSSARARRAGRAQQLARAGHDVTVFEKNDRIGGLLRYGIPDFKMEKRTSTGASRRCRPRA
jgi:glutamate synthase (NADPH/NADH) small chain